jgi:hypothetical protein
MLIRLRCRTLKNKTAPLQGLNQQRWISRDMGIDAKQNSIREGVMRDQFQAIIQYGS